MSVAEKIEARVVELLVPSLITDRGSPVLVSRFYVVVDVDGVLYAPRSARRQGMARQYRTEFGAQNKAMEVNRRIAEGWSPVGMKDWEILEKFAPENAPQ